MIWRSLLAGPAIGRSLTPDQVVVAVGLFVLALVVFGRSTVRTIITRVLMLVAYLVNPLAPRRTFRYRGWAWLWSVVSVPVATILALIGVIPIARLHSLLLEAGVLVVGDVIVARLHPIRLLGDLSWAILEPLHFAVRGGWLRLKVTVMRRHRPDSPEILGTPRRHPDGRLRVVKPTLPVADVIVTERVPQLAMNGLALVSEPYERSWDELAAY